MTRSDGHTLEDYIRLKAVLAEVFLEKLAESLMLKRRQLTLNQNLRDRPTRVHPKTPALDQARQALRDVERCAPCL
jgi:hypothetical protein